MHNEILTGGAWYRPRLWSEEAKKTGLLIEVLQDGKKSYLVGYDTDEEASRRAAVKYDKAKRTVAEDIEQAEKAKDAVINDVWQIDIQPEIVRTLAEESKEAYDQLIDKLMLQHGCKNILYIDYGHEQEVDGLNLEKEVIIGNERDIILLLVDEKIGMPIFEFLSWLKGDEKTTHLRLISEWSGVPTDEIEWVYERLVGFFRYCLRQTKVEA